MATGILNPADHTRTTVARPAAEPTGVNERRWFSDLLGTYPKAHELNGLLALIRAAGDFYAVADTEGDDDYLRKVFQAAARERLAANRTYYVRADGNDSNTGLADNAGGAFLTLQKAIDVAGALDLNGFTVTIQARTGTYTAGISRARPFINGTVLLIGDAVTPANVVVSTSTDVISLERCRLSISGMKLTTTTGSLIVAKDATVTVDGAMEFGSASQFHCRAIDKGAIYFNAAYTVSGGGLAHLSGLTNGLFEYASGIGATLSGTPAFSQAFLNIQRQSIAVLSTSTVFTGAATGRRFLIDDASDILIASGTDPDTVLPGSTLGITRSRFDGERRFRNLLLNASGRLQGGQSGAIGDDTYGLHQNWYALAQSGNVTPASLADVQDGLPFMIRLTQASASAQRFGYAQIIEGKNCRHLRGKQSTLSGLMRCSVSTTLRFAVLEWTGTEDAVTSDVVASWSSGTFTPGNFFIASNLAVAGDDSKALTANALTPFSMSVNLSSAFNNLIVFVWTNTTQAQNVTADLVAQLEDGGYATRLEHRPIGVEETLCARYYQAMTVRTENGSRRIGLPVKMRAAPVVNATAGTPANAQPEGFELSHTSAADSGITADARL